MATVFPASAVPTVAGLPLCQFDAAQYIAMADAGVFEDHPRVDLIGGYVVGMSPAGSDHNYITIKLNRLFIPVAAEFLVSVQGTLQLDERDVFDPDFMLLRPRELSYRKAMPTPADVALLIEGSASSREKDERVKMPIYAATGIPEFWIVDLAREAVVVHRQPQGDAYAVVKEHAGDDRIEPLATGGFSLQVSNLFA